jgi:4'-phosphopantetheinyl transferase
MSEVSTLPEGDEWLGPEERAVQAKLKLLKRRTEWRLGRLTAKRLLSADVGVERLDRIQIIAAHDGAPEAFVDGTRLPGSVSISHRSGVAACVASELAGVGCDLEAVEPRSQRFIHDFFTERERHAIRGTESLVRDRHVALTWSAKESALKVLRVGLRRDTRSVEVCIEDPAAGGADWHPFTAAVSPENRRFIGRWRLEGDLVLTLICEDPALCVAGHDEQR